MPLLSSAPVIRGVSPRANTQQGVGGFRRSALVVAIASAVGVAGPAMFPRSAMAAPLEETLTGVNIEVISAVAGVTGHEMTAPDGVLLTVDGGSSIVASGAGGTDTAGVRILNSGPVAVTLDTALLSADSSTNAAAALAIYENAGAVTVDATALDLSVTAGGGAAGIRADAYDYDEFGVIPTTYYDASLSLLDSTLTVEGTGITVGVAAGGATTDVSITGGTLSVTNTSDTAIGVSAGATDVLTVTLDGTAIAATGGDYAEGVSLSGPTASLSLLGGTRVEAAAGWFGWDLSTFGAQIFGQSTTVQLDDASIVADGRGIVTGLQTWASGDGAATSVSLATAAVLSATSANGDATGLHMTSGGGAGGTLLLDVTGGSGIHASGAGQTYGTWIHQVGQAIDVSIDTASLSADSSMYAAALMIYDNAGAVTVDASALDLSVTAGAQATGIRADAYDYDEFGVMPTMYYDASLSLLDSTLTVEGAGRAFGVQLAGATTDVSITGGTLSVTATETLSQVFGVIAGATDGLTVTLDGTTITAAGGEYADGAIFSGTTASLSLLGGTRIEASAGRFAWDPSTFGARVYGESTTVLLDDSSIVADGRGGVTGLQTWAIGDGAATSVSLATGAVLSATSANGVATGLHMTSGGGAGGTLLLDVAGGSEIRASGAWQAHGAWISDAGQAIDVNIDTASLSADSSMYAAALMIEGNDGAVTVDATALNLSATAGIQATGIRVSAWGFDDLDPPGSTYYDASLSLLDSMLTVQGADFAYGLEMFGATADMSITGGELSVTSSSAGNAVGVGAIAMSAATMTLDGTTITTTGGESADGVRLSGTTASLSLLGGASVGTTTEATGWGTFGVRMSGGLMAVQLDDASIVADGYGVVMALQMGASGDDAATSVSLATGAVLSATSANGEAVGLQMTSGGGAGGTLLLDVAGGSEIRASGARETHGAWIYNADQAIDVNIDTASLSADSSTNSATALRIEGNAGAVTVDATALDLSATAGMQATGMHVGAYDYDEFGFPTNTYYDASLSLLDSTLVVQGTDTAFGVELIGATTDVSITGGTLSATATMYGASGVSINATDTATMTLDGTAITATGGDYVDGLMLQGFTTSLSLLGGASVVATGTVSATATRLSANDASVTLAGGSSLYADALASDSSVGLWLSALSSTVSIDDTSSITGGAANATGSDNAAITVASGSSTLTNAGVVYSPATGLQVQAGADAAFFNLASGALQGLDYAASGNISLDNLGLVAGRLDVQTYVAQAGSVSRAYIDAATPVLASGIAYWNVAGTATLAAGANIDVILAPDFRDTIRSDGSTPEYLLLRAGILAADPASLHLSSGPLVNVEFIEGLPAGDLGIHIDVLDCAEANLTPNGQAACLAADAGGGFVFDYNGDPDLWAPSVSGMTRGAARAATGQLASAIRQRLGGGGMNSGDEPGSGYMLWLDARGMEASQDAINGVAGYDAEGTLATMGLDAGGENLRGGLAVTAAGSESSEVGGTGDAESDATIISLYGQWLSVAGDFELVLGAGDWNTVASRIAGSERISADYDSAQLGAGLWWSKSLGQRWQFVPQLAAAYHQLDTDDHVETGDGTPTSQALVVARQVYEEAEVGAGFRLARAFAAGRGATFSPGLELMQWHELVNEATQVTAGFITGSPLFSTQGMAPAEDRTAAAVSLEYLAGNGLRVELRAESDFADDYEGQALAGKLEYRF